MNDVVDNMKQAKLYSSNEIQTNMHTEYIATFTDGDIEKHKNSQRWWIKDKGPIVEQNIGFVETY